MGSALFLVDGEAESYQRVGTGTRILSSEPTASPGARVAWRGLALKATVSTPIIESILVSLTQLSTHRGPASIFSFNNFLTRHPEG